MVNADLVFCFFFPSDFMVLTPSYTYLAFDLKYFWLAGLPWTPVLWSSRCTVYFEIGSSWCLFSWVDILEGVVVLSRKDMSICAGEFPPVTTISLCWCRLSMLDIHCHDFWNRFLSISPFKDFPLFVTDAPGNSTVDHLFNRYMLLVVTLQSSLYLYNSPGQLGLHLYLQLL